MFELIELLLHLVEIALQHFVSLLVRPLLLAALGEFAFKLRHRLRLLLDAFESLLHKLDLDEALLVLLFLQSHGGLAGGSKVDERMRRTLERRSRAMSRISSFSLTTLRSASTLMAAVDCSSATRACQGASEDTGREGVSDVHPAVSE